MYMHYLLLMLCSMLNSKHNCVCPIISCNFLYVHVLIVCVRACACVYVCVCVSVHECVRVFVIEPSNQGIYNLPTIYRTSVEDQRVA